MNSLLCRAFAELVSSPSTRKQVLLHPIFLLQSSSLYSNTTSKNNHRIRKPLPPPPPPPPPPSSSSKVKEKGMKVSSDSNGWPWPKPSEIPWQAKVANSVNLIGYVQMPVQFQTSPDGKYWAGTIITQDTTSDSPPLWIPIIFEGDLAHIAACHLREKDCVYIVGQLSTDPPPFSTSQAQANVQVMVHSINFVQGSSQMKKSFASHEQEEWACNPASVKDDISINQSWKDLLAKPHGWWDIRSKNAKQGNSMDAAFERKDNGQLLWINDSTPEWIRRKLESLTFDRKIVQKSPNSASMTKDGDYESSPWRDLLNNPKQWWDHRDNKLRGLVNPRHPDFKPKDGGLSLWLNRAPEWVLSELGGLEFDVQFQKPKQAKDLKEDNSWKNLVENPDKWWDNRSRKAKEKSPDFRHKDTGEGLWLSDSPAWVLSKLPPLKTKKDASIGKKDTLLS